MEKPFEEQGSVFKFVLQVKWCKCAYTEMLKQLVSLMFSRLDQFSEFQPLSLDTLIQCVAQA